MFYFKLRLPLSEASVKTKDHGREKGFIAVTVSAGMHSPKPNIKT